MRFTQEETNMYATAMLSYGLPINANFFVAYFKVSRERAEELESYQSSFTSTEVAKIKQATESPK